MKHLAAMLLVPALLLGWLLVQELSRRFARAHPELGPFREEGGGCGGNCACRGGNCHSLRRRPAPGPNVETVRGGGVAPARVGGPPAGRTLETVRGEGAAPTAGGPLQHRTGKPTATSR